MSLPPGLEYLKTLDSLFVEQSGIGIQPLTGYDIDYKYLIKRMDGTQLYMAAEESGACAQMCFGPLRGFNMSIIDNYGTKIMHFKRPFRCAKWCCFCCLQKMQCYAPPGQLCGSIEQQCTLCTPKYIIKDATGKPVLRIEGPSCTCCTFEVEFTILSISGGVVGQIFNKWEAFAEDLFTHTRFFGISFPKDLDVRMKVVMLGACFLFDYVYFET